MTETRLSSSTRDGLRIVGRGALAALVALPLAVAAEGPPAGVSPEEWTGIEQQIEAEHHKVTESRRPDRLWRAATFQREGSTALLSYSGLAAWDAAGEPVEARMELAAGGTRRRRSGLQLGNRLRLLADESPFVALGAETGGPSALSLGPGTTDDSSDVGTGGCKTLPYSSWCRRASVPW